MPTHPFDLTGKLALVTGSSRGIGLALASSLLGAGATIVIHGQDPERAGTTADALRSEYEPARVYSTAFDITDESAAADGIRDIEANIGPLGILINNAGIQHREPLLDVSVDNWDRVIRTNLTGAFLVGREVARAMIPRRNGKVINICSIQSELARPTIAAYAVAKGGLRNLTKAMAAEWAVSGIQVNGIAPGYIRTELTQPLVDDAEFNAWVLGRTPAGRWGEPEDLGGTAIWLASDASRFVNGQVVFVDGGMTAIV